MAVAATEDWEVGRRADPHKFIVRIVGDSLSLSLSSGKVVLVKKSSRGGIIVALPTQRWIYVSVDGA